MGTATKPVGAAVSGHHRWFSREANRVHQVPFRSRVAGSWLVTLWTLPHPSCVKLYHS
uniref:Uncharacterized protein n=1 Tax=Ulva partita TaxID=1605170 RepID=A0A1C9ZPI4_9CHLO|nr:hypothetical protein [Ulva partita]